MGDFSPIISWVHWFLHDSHAASHSAHWHLSTSHSWEGTAWDVSEMGDRYRSGAQEYCGSNMHPDNDILMALSDALENGYMVSHDFGPIRGVAQEVVHFDEVAPFSIGMRPIPPEE
jgi:hypothetical protein